MSSASGHMKPPIQLLDLPTEILFKILCLLPASSLLTTTRVSKLFYETYHSSSFLQYIVALHTTHQKDFDDCTLPPSEKLQLLRERDARWKSAKWKRRQSVLCDEGNRGTLYDLLGGVLAIAVDKPCRTLRFYKMPSTFGGTAVLSRDFMPGIVVKDFTMDPSQDLLVLIEVIIPSPRRWSYRMHFYSLTKLQPHPLAKEHILTFPYRLSDNRCSPFISVMDDMVCLHASTAGEGSPEGGIGIWDWKRGVAVSAHPSTSSEEIESIAFIGPDLFLLAAYDFEEEEALIQLYTFDSHYVPPTTESTASSVVSPAPILLATYQLPTASYRPETMTIRLDPAPGVGDVVPPFAEGDGKDSKPAFQMNNEERLVVVDMSFIAPNTRGGMSSHRFTLFALKTFFMKALRHAPSLSTLHQRNGTPASSKNKSDIKEMDVSMPGQYHGGKGDGGKDDWEDAPGGDAGDEWEDDEHSAVHYPFEDWQEKCRIIPDIPLQFAWVLYVYGCKFVHPTGRPINPESTQISIAPRILDFSPFSVSRLSTSNPPPPKRSSTPSIFGVTENDEFGSDPSPGPPAVAEREDGDIGNLVELPTIVPPGRVFEGGLRTGAALPYVERQMEEVTVDDLTSMNRESVAGLTIDEQRVVVVKSTRTGELIMDTLLF